MRITDLNREGGIGSNSMLVELGKFEFIIDAGLHPKRAGYEAIPDYSFTKGRDIQFILITHCHLDHIGSLPVLLNQHPKARVYMSQASHMLVERMLHNSCNVMKRQKAEKHIEEYPLFTHEDIDGIASRLEAIPFNKPITFHAGGEELEVKLHLAGHVAGAGGFELKYQGRKILFTGDVLFDDQRILPGAKFPSPAKFDTVVMETTRGETERKTTNTREEEIDRMLEAICHTLERGGSALIPVFALGRMQEMLTIINQSRKSGKIPNCPIYGAGLGLDIAGYFDQITKRTGALKFSNKTIKELRLKRPPKKLTPGKEPAGQGIYILSSGMLVQHTPSYHLAATIIAHARNSILFVGYCDPDTPGGKLLFSKAGDTMLFDTLDYETPIRAQIEKFELSGHADREELLEFVTASNPRSIVLTHGDPGARSWFEKQLIDWNPEIKVTDPVPLKTVEV